MIQFKIFSLPEKLLYPFKYYGMFKIISFEKSYNHTNITIYFEYQKSFISYLNSIPLQTLPYILERREYLIAKMIHQHGNNSQSRHELEI